MAIKIIYGPGGSGKSYFQVRCVLEELRTTKRNIVTNLSLDIPALAAYCEKHYPKESLRIGERVRLLAESETPNFWKIRGPMRWTGHEYEFHEDKGSDGVAYFIDEAGACGFGAKEWNAQAGRSTRGVECSAYLDQQRKYGDNVYFSVNGRTPIMIAKDIRDRGHEFIALRNGYLKKYGPFKARGRFTAKRFSCEPSSNSEPFAVEHWGMDETGVASCYKTEAGVGVVGSGADKGAKVKGIPVVFAIPMWIAAAMLAVGLPTLGLQKILGKAPVVAPQATPAKQSGEQSAASMVNPDALWVTRFGVFGDRAVVYLSDGRKLTEQDTALQAIERSRIKVAGSWIPVRLETQNPPATGPGGS